MTSGQGGRAFKQSRLLPPKDECIPWNDGEERSILPLKQFICLPSV